MAKIFSAIVILLGVLSVDKAQAVVVDGYNYIQFCIPGNACVINRISQETGISIYLIREGQTFPGLQRAIEGGVQRDPTSGEWIGGISAAKYAAIVSAGLDTVEVNPDDLQKEIDKAQTDIDDNLYDCLWGAAGCGVTGLAALGSGRWALGGAGLACVSIYRACKALDKVNKDLFKKRDEAKAKLKKYAEDKLAESGNQTGGGSINGEPTSGGGVQPTPIVNPPVSPPRRGEVTIDESID